MPTAATPPMPLRPPLVWVAQSWWVDEIYEGIAKVAAEKGWRLDARMRWHRGSLPPSHADGVIVFTGDNTPMIDEVKRLAAPTVDIETYADHYGAPKVIGDDTLIGERAALHLGALSPARLVFITPSVSGPVSEGRRSGFLSGAAKLALPVSVMELRQFDPFALTSEGRIAVFAPGDILAAEVIHRCVEAGLRVPEEIAVLGADDSRTVCEHAPVPLSSVNMGFEAKGRAAAELLDRLMRGETPPTRPGIVPPAGITVRASTAVESTGHAELDLLLRHLRENAHRPECLSLLYEECGISERTAQHLFQSKLGKRPLTVLSEIRLDLAARFAADRRLTREAIAKAAGFPSREAMVRAERAR